MVGIDQDTGDKTKEPLMSLSAFRAGKVSEEQLLYAAFVYMKREITLPVISLFSR